MKFSIREIQTFIYLILMLISLVVLIISFNDLVIKNSSFINSGLTFGQAGNWNYWILTISFIAFAIFAYIFFRLTSSVRKFRSIVSGSSKQNFLKNLKDLEALAKKLGPSFEESLSAAKLRWNVK